MSQCNECKYKNSCDNLNYLDVANTCADLREFVDEIRTDVIDECIEKLAKSDDTILSDRQYYTLIELKEQK